MIEYKTEYVEVEDLSHLPGLFESLSADGWDVFCVRWEFTTAGRGYFMIRYFAKRPKVMP